MRPADTSPEAWKVFLDLLRKMRPEEKLRRTFEFSALVRSFGDAGIRQAHPNATEPEIFAAAARRVPGKELFRQVNGDGPAAGHA